MLAGHEDLVQRKFTTAGPDRTFVVHRHHRTPHQGREGVLLRRPGRVTRQVVGWSISNHIRSDLIVDALPMATWRRRPERDHRARRQGSQDGFNWLSQLPRRGGVEGAGRTR